MSNNRRDESVLQIPITVVPEGTLEASGSKEFDGQKESIIIPIEQYPGAMTEDEVRAMRQQQVGSYPDLFYVRNCPDDKESETESLQLSKPTQMFATLLEAKVKQNSKAGGSKVQN